MCDKHKLDIEQIINLVKQMSDNAVAIKDLIPESQSHLLRHIAASCIHFTFFMKDLVYTTKIAKINDIERHEKVEEDFLKECGCNIDTTEHIPNCS